ncbi:RecX family transcriptional regulator [bacterium]|nr:RecX family transcriptional regulator [bacterium]
MPWKRKKEGRFIVVQKGKAQFQLPPLFWRRLRTLFEAEAKAEEIRKALLGLVKERVLLFVARRDRSEKEIRQYLVRLKQEWAEEKIIRWLKRLKLLDDRKFVRQVIDYQKSRLRGPLYIKHWLLQRGISREVVEEELAKRYTEENERKIILKLKRRHLKGKSRKAKARFRRFLRQRGFRLTE